MAELVDALVSEASEETHGGSSPLGHTIKQIMTPYRCFLFCYPPADVYNLKIYYD